MACCAAHRRGKEDAESAASADAGANGRQSAEDRDLRGDEAEQLKQAAAEEAQQNIKENETIVAADTAAETKRLLREAKERLRDLPPGKTLWRRSGGGGGGCCCGCCCGCCWLCKHPCWPYLSATRPSNHHAHVKPREPASSALTARILPLPLARHFGGFARLAVVM